MGPLQLALERQCWVKTDVAVSWTKSIPSIEDPRIKSVVPPNHRWTWHGRYFSTVLLAPLSCLPCHYGLPGVIETNRRQEQNCTTCKFLENTTSLVSIIGALLGCCKLSVKGHQLLQSYLEVNELSVLRHLFFLPVTVTIHTCDKLLVVWA